MYKDLSRWVISITKTLRCNKNFCSSLVSCTTHISISLTGIFRLWIYVSWLSDLWWRLENHVLGELNWPCREKQTSKQGGARIRRRRRQMRRKKRYRRRKRRRWRRRGRGRRRWLRIGQFVHKLHCWRRHSLNLCLSFSATWWWWWWWHGWWG